MLKTIMLGAALAAMVTGCADMNQRQRNTAIGAGAGAVLGSVLTNGDSLGTLGGAAVGGIIGHQTR
ncbi:glycine zipper 2TM domain-containing protein [Crenobacter oryzisoli]